MKILQSCGSRSWGGLEMQALLVSRELQRRGHELSLLCMPRTRLLKEAYAAGVPTVGMLGGDKQALTTIRDLARLLRNYDYDVIHTHHSHDLWWLVPAMKLASSRASLFLTKHVASGVRKTDPLHRILYGRVQGIFAISEYIRGSVINTCPVHSSGVHVVPPGIMLETFDPLSHDGTAVRKELGIPRGKTVVGMLGRITPGKGHEEFLRAAGILAGYDDLDLRFVVVGGPSKGEQSVEAAVRKLADDLGLGDTLVFTGFRNDVPDILSAFDVLAFPSHEESFGLTVVEAMAMRLPVVASGNAGVLDIVVDGQTGILVPPKDHVALAEGIARLARDRALRAEYGDAGRKRAEELFSIGSVVDRLERFYNEGKFRD